MEIPIPETVRRKAEQVGAGAWLAGLPELVADLVAAWSLELGRPLAGGTEAWVAEVRTASGEDAVLKIVVPRHRYADMEIEVLRAVDGDGCVRLLDSDADRGALLLERLGDPLSETDLSAVERQRILTRLAQRVWRPLPEAARRSGLIVDGRAKADSLAEFIPDVWERAGEPIPRSVVDEALDCARRRRDAWDPFRATLVHGDLHAWNALQIPGEDDWALIDPDGIEIEPEYDLGVIMREDPVELIEEGARSRAGRLAAWTGCDADAIWEWGVVERVSTGLLARTIGLEPVGSQMLEAAVHVAAHPES